MDISLDRIFESSVASLRDSDKELEHFCDYLYKQQIKGKIPLIVTGAGISMGGVGTDETIVTIPSVIGMITKLLKFARESRKDGIEYSTFLSSVIKYSDEVIKGLSISEQSRLLTYFQNGYLDKKEYVDPADIDLLADVWNKFVIWLLKDCITDGLGLIDAPATKTHIFITELYRDLGAVCITTNFDNLLCKAFKEKGENAYPLLDANDCEKYYTNISDDKSYIEIQSRGDVFWQNCTGRKKKTCDNTNRQCFIPGENSKIEGNRIVCNHCGSEVKVYFAFPGTKEKDREMATIISKVWKYLAFRLSALIVVGSSLNYDPVLLNFLLELLKERGIPLLYISRNKSDNMITRFICEKPEYDSFWILGNAQDCMDKLVQKYRGIEKKIETDENDNFSTSVTHIKNLMVNNIGKSDKFQDIIQELREVHQDLIDNETVTKLSSCSQLGLKTYWLTGSNEIHNRFKHSIGVMIIASYIYLRIVPETKRKKNEYRFLRLGAILHDLGHLPFSHLFEEIFEEFGWIPFGEAKAFNHMKYTSIRVKDLLNNSELKKILERIGYTEKDLINLINGEFGVGYLDAIVNSPIDADKMEYLFSDAIITGSSDKVLFQKFMEGFTSNLFADKNGFLVIKEKSVKYVIELLEMRGRLYTNLYLRRGLRFLEACCKLIINTFIAHKCTEEKLFERICDRKENAANLHNLSEVKINYILEWLNSQINTPSGELCELRIIREMKDNLINNDAISEEIQKAVEKCYDFIINTKTEKQIEKIEDDRVVSYQVVKPDFDKSELKDLMRNIQFRFPGVLLIDYVKSISAFSFSRAGKRRKRADGTVESMENILISPIQQSKSPKDQYVSFSDSTPAIAAHLNMDNSSYIYFYRITDDRYQYMKAEDYVLNFLRSENIIKG